MVYVFCHNPTGPHRHCKAFWDVGLHTDVRFRLGLVFNTAQRSEIVLSHRTSKLLCCFNVSDRNYLEHVADTISDWTREEELKREAAKAKDTSPAERPEGDGVDD